MNQGDIFSWSYSEAKEKAAHDRGSDPYWCCSRIAEFDGKRLRDTYWQIGDWSTSDGRSWTPEEAESLRLTFIANREDLECYGPEAHDYYDPSDVVDLRHPNRSSRELVCVRKGAKRSAAVMRQTLEYTIERSESDIDMANRRIEHCRGLLDKINGGDLSGYVISYE